AEVDDAVLAGHPVLEHRVRLQLLLGLLQCLARGGAVLPRLLESLLGGAVPRVGVRQAVPRVADAPSGLPVAGAGLLDRPDAGEALEPPAGRHPLAVGEEVLVELRLAPRPRRR